MKHKKKYLVIGTGKTGLSCIDYLYKNNENIVIADTRSVPPNLEVIKNKYPNIRVQSGQITNDLINDSDVLVVSPGISFNESFIQKALELQKEVIGDIELFVKKTKAPIIAVTGTNGKTTVTTIIGEMCKNNGLNTIVGGNIGTPVLELLKKPVPDVYVLELSSFQLQTTHSMKFDVSVLPNISEDHIDHHGTMENYIQAKLKIFKNCKNAVINKILLTEVGWSTCFSRKNNTLFIFSLDESINSNSVGIKEFKEENYLFDHESAIMSVSDLKIEGTHNQENALAAYAAGKAFGLKHNMMIEVLRNFSGIRHRCQLITEANGIKWYNDSKATNVGATIAAVNGLGNEKKNIILVLGGIGKDADFKPLAEPIKKYTKALILFGRDADLINKDLNDCSNTVYAESLQDVINKAGALAQSGDIILFAPACASFDMFKNYEHRGDEFERMVKEKLIGKVDL